MLKDKQIVKIVCFKHNKTVHRIWDNGLVVSNKPDFLVIANNKSTVFEDDGRYWSPSDPCYYVFLKDEWYNIIITLKDNKVNYYVNLASPYVIQEDKICYIDYDLDVSLKINQTLKILDEKEYVHHYKDMNYSLDIDYKLSETLYKVLKLIKKKEFPFIDDLYLKFEKERNND